MKLMHHNGRFVALSSYEERALPKDAGFRWYPLEKQWWTSDVKNAAKLIAWADDECRAALAEADRERTDTLAASRAEDAEIDVPVPEGKALMPFQRAGVAWLLSHPRALVGDEMGLGKTVETIGLINAAPAIQRVLIICPASLKSNWRNELKTWLTRPLTIGIADRHTYPAADIVVINYESLFGEDLEVPTDGRRKKKKRSIEFFYQHDALKREYDLLVVDECHRCKNPDANRSRAVYGINAKRMAFLTGTPLVNRPVELWPIISHLDRETWYWTTPQGQRKPTFFKYAKRYCAAFQTGRGWDMSGASHLDELQEILRTTIMIRRLKSQVLTELPPKRRQIIEIEPNGAADSIRAEIEAYERHEESLANLRAEVEMAKASEDATEYETAVARLRSAGRIAFTELSRLRHETALAKVPKAIEHVEDIIDGGAKVIVFAHHKDVIAMIAEAFGAAAVTLTGDTSLSDRDEAVQRFQTNEQIRVIIGSIAAAGVGLTLTASSTVVFAELDWVPGNITQAEDRAHRIGQAESVLVQHLVFDGSLDAKMAKVLVRKQAVADAALDREKKPEVAAEAQEFEAVPQIDDAATQTTSRAKLATEAATLSADDVRLIHQSLRALAGVCDFANAIDGAGFNKIDATIGHSLAEAPRLSAKQAALGKKVLRKYKRQLPSEWYRGVFGQPAETAL